MILGWFLCDSFSDSFIFACNSFRNSHIFTWLFKRLIYFHVIQWFIYFYMWFFSDSFFHLILLVVCLLSHANSSSDSYIFSHVILSVIRAFPLVILSMIRFFSHVTLSMIPLFWLVILPVLRLFSHVTLYRIHLHMWFFRWFVYFHATPPTQCCLVLAWFHILHN